MRFVGHLDIMRFFQKAIRRAGIDVAFSGGFSPHMIMSFAAPLGVGITSTGEYFDLDINTPMSSKEMVRRLNEVMVDGMKVLSVVQISEDKKYKAMTMVAGADYLVGFREGKSMDHWKRKFQKFMDKESISILKKSKKSERIVELKPLIHEWHFQQEGVFLKLSCGSVDNVKPELVMEAFANELGFPLDPLSLWVHRVETYALIEDEGEKRFVALEELGEVIE